MGNVRQIWENVMPISPGLIPNGRVINLYTVHLFVNSTIFLVNVKLDHEEF